jgi:hypothetical protein
MKQVLMRRKNRFDQIDLIRVDVLSESDGKMRVKVPGMFYAKEINASETLPCPQQRNFGMTVPTRVYSTPGSLARDLHR